MAYITVDSCHSRWIFDAERMRYRRVPQGPGLGVRAAMTEWRPYCSLHLEPDSESFVVVLDDAGSRMLRSWRHTQAVCSQCGATKTEELSVDDIARIESG